MGLACESGAGLVDLLLRPLGTRGLSFHFLFLAHSPPELCPEASFTALSLALQTGQASPSVECKQRPRGPLSAGVWGGRAPAESSFGLSVVRLAFRSSLGDGYLLIDLLIDRESPPPV